MLFLAHPGARASQLGLRTVPSTPLFLGTEPSGRMHTKGVESQDQAPMEDEIPSFERNHPLSFSLTRSRRPRNGHLLLSLHY